MATRGVLEVWRGDRPCLSIDRDDRDIDDPTSPPFSLRGTSVCTVVDDIESFEGVTIERSGALVVAKSSRLVVQALDAAAHAEDHVLIVGARRLGDQLAARYAGKLGRRHRFRPGGDQPLDHLLATREGVRTVVIDLVRSMPEYDLVALAHWLETDVRFVTLSDGERPDWIPPSILERATRIALPHPRFDEIPTIIQDRVAAAVDGASVHAGAIALLLILLHDMPEDHWFESFDFMLGGWRPTGAPVLHNADVQRLWRSLR